MLIFEEVPSKSNVAGHLGQLEQKMKDADLWTRTS